MNSSHNSSNVKKRMKKMLNIVNFNDIKKENLLIMSIPSCENQKEKSINNYVSKSWNNLEIKNRMNLNFNGFPCFNTDKLNFRVSFGRKANGSLSTNNSSRNKKGKYGVCSWFNSVNINSGQIFQSSSLFNKNNQEFYNSKCNDNCTPKFSEIVNQ